MKYSTFNRVALLYDFIVKYILKEDKKTLKLFKKYLNFGNHYKIIDIGGGTGIITKIIAKKNNNLTILDPSHNLISKVDCARISLIIGSGTIIPIKDQIYDIALLIQTLHHINVKEHEKILKESFRILNKNGKLFIIDLLKPDNFIKKIFARCDQFTSGGKIYFQNPADLKYLLEKIGFNKIDVFEGIRNSRENLDWRYVIIAEK